MEKESMKKFSNIIPFFFLVLAFLIVGGIETGGIPFKGGILIALLCIIAFGFTSKMEGLWYEP